MPAFWMKFTGHKASCVEAETEAKAKVLAAELAASTVIACDRIPYPAEPRLNKHVDEKWGVCPAFCFQPERCKGKTACPSNYSCTE